jgi:hypothetical protein
MCEVCFSVHSTVNVVSFCVVFLYSLSSPLVSMWWQITQGCNILLTAPNIHMHTNVSSYGVLRCFRKIAKSDY